MNKNQKGFGATSLILIVLIVGIIGFVGFTVASKSKDNKENVNIGQTAESSSLTGNKDNEFIWRQTENGWEPQGEAPECPSQPMLKTPADLSNVTSVLYPGQVRGTTSYKPHGGLRFDNSTDNAIEVSSPIDGYIINGVRHIADGGTEVQYAFSIMNNCGVAVTIGHLRELTPDLQKIAETFPEPTQNSATHNVSPPVYIKQGEVLATKIGILGDKNTFFDWGVYDYRQRNKASQSESYQATHNNSKDTTWHAVCWLQDGWLSLEDQSTLAALPSNDKRSDYCT